MIQGIDLVEHGILWRVVAILDYPQPQGNMCRSRQRLQHGDHLVLGSCNETTHTARSIDHKCQVHRIYFIAHSHTPIGPVGRLGSSKLMIISTSSALLGSARSGKTLGSE